MPSAHGVLRLPFLSILPLGEQVESALEIEALSLVGETSTSLLTACGSERGERNNQVSVSHAWSLEEYLNEYSWRNT